MSRGPGKLQRRVLAELEGAESASVSDLAGAIHGEPITLSQYESTRRAVHGLIRRGEVAAWRGHPDRQRVCRDDGTTRWRNLYLSVGNRSYDRNPTHTD